MADRKKLLCGLTAAIGLTAAAAAGLAVWVRGMPHEPAYITVLSGVIDESKTVRAGDQTDQPDHTDGSAETAATQTEAETTSTAAEETVTTETAAPNRDLNTATEAELRRVSGVGELLAAEIVHYRTVHGGFRRRAELLEIPGIGEVLAGRIMQEFEIPDELPPETTVTAITTGTTSTAVTAVTTLTQTETESAAATEETAHPFFDLSTVTEAELLEIPGMREEMAQGVLDLRERLGAFESVYELALVPGFSGEYVVHTAWEYLYIVGDTVDKPRQWQIAQGIRDSAAG